MARFFVLLSAAVILTPLLPGSEPTSSASKNHGDAQALSAIIDQHLGAKWGVAKVEPARPADDAEFMRRLYLDLAGRIPSVAEARAFLEDSAADKRQRLVEKLLIGPGYVRHFTNVWRGLLIPEANSSIEVRFALGGFEGWLRQKIKKNAGYDQLVREIITAPMNGNPEYGRVPGDMRGATSPEAFYRAKEVKPENLAASTARIFLGIRLECAQCHNHPFAAWKQTQFWEYASFFAGLQKQGDDNQFGQVREIHDRRELAIPGTDKVVQASFPDGTEPQWKFKVGSRVTLADWMTSPNNPYFARAAVNRLWAHFFGLGFVEPVDNLDSDNPPSHPELLNEMARQFAAHGYDLKFLIRAITLSRAYQLSSAVRQPGASPSMSVEEAQLFGRMAVRGLSPEQMFDSIAQAIGFKEPVNPDMRQAVILGQSPARAQFLAKFTEQGDRRTEIQTSILQALSLMNGQLIAEATDLEKSETLAAVADAPFLSTAEQVETLYLATLSRKPRPEELVRLTKYVDAEGSKQKAVGTLSYVVASLAIGRKPRPEEMAKLNSTYLNTDRKKALADVFWALLNSGEFILNH